MELNLWLKNLSCRTVPSVQTSSIIQFFFATTKQPLWRLPVPLYVILFVSFNYFNLQCIISLFVILWLFFFFRYYYAYIYVSMHLDEPLSRWFQYSNALRFKFHNLNCSDKKFKKKKSEGKKYHFMVRTQCVPGLEVSI